jgi:transcriptional regulator with XRE-family HTH domain
MVGQRRRTEPKHLETKLRAIRQRFGASQSEMISILDCDLTCARISEYETGVRIPNLLVLLRYARIAGVHVDDLIDDKLNPAKLRSV